MSRKFWLATTISIFSLASPAHAANTDDTAELKALVRDLSAEVKMLRSQQTELQSRVEAAETKAAPSPHPTSAATGMAATAAPQPEERKAPPGTFLIPGTDTTMKIGGYVKLDVIDDLQGTNANGATIDFATIQIKGTPQARRRDQVNITARQSRLFVDTRSPTDYGELKTFIEGDFEGADGNSLETNSAVFRLRHLYGSLGRVLAGQTWSNFYDVEAAPETIEFGGPVGVVYSIRQAQLRYTAPIGATGNLSVAIENPEGDFFGADHGSLGTNGTASSTRVLNQVPDLTARYVLAKPWGRFSLAGVVRDINLDTGGSSLSFQGPNGTFTYNGKANTWGGGGVLTAQFPIYGKDTLTFWAVGGPGIGRYLQQAQDAAVNVALAPNGLTNANPGDGAVLDQHGGLHSIVGMGGNIWYRHYWTDTLRSNATFGVTHHDNPLAYLPVNTLKQEESLHVNLIWSPIPRTNFGVEYVWGRVDLNGQTAPNKALGYGTNGTMSRVQFGAQYFF